MNLQQQLQLKFSLISFRDVTQLMGYNKSGRVKAATRISKVLSDSQMNLYAGKYDFKYSDEQFLDKLCQVVGINISDYQDELDAIHADYNDNRDRYKSYIFIDTNFKRAGQTLISMTFCDSQRYIKLDYEVGLKKLSEQVDYVESLVKQHYTETEGNIGLWGDIQRYIFIYAEGCQLTLNPDGVLLEDESVAIVANKSTLRIGGADITSLLGKSNKQILK